MDRKQIIPTMLVGGFHRVKNGFQLKVQNANQNRCWTVSTHGGVDYQNFISMFSHLVEWLRLRLAVQITVQATGKRSGPWKANMTHKRLTSDEIRCDFWRVPKLWLTVKITFCFYRSQTVKRVFSEFSVNAFTFRSHFLLGHSLVWTLVKKSVLQTF